MFDELKKYKSSKNFIFNAIDELDKVCNAPETGAGVYLVYAIEKGESNLIFVGSSGTVQGNGTLKVKGGGLRDKIVNGKQFDAIRKYSWPKQMKAEKMETLQVYWYETFVKKDKDIPTAVEGLILQQYLNEKGCLPKWNKAF